MTTLRIVDARGTDHVGRTVRVRGWVRTRRDSKGGFSFLEVNDGSCLGNLQVVADQNLSNYESTVRHIPAGASVTVEGVLKASPAAEQATELAATSVTLHGGADPESYPLQKKRHTLEKLREWAHLRPRTNTIGAVARVRNRLSYSIHQFFQDLGFLYVHTPIITASDCEGAGAMFRVTTLDADKPPRTAAGAVDAAQDFFGRPAYLTVSGQLEGEIYACALGQIYTFGPTFRAENSNTARHLAEFWMVEPEMAFYDLQDNMDLAERFIQRLVGDVLTDCREDMEFFAERIDKGAIARAENILADRFARVEYSEAIEILLASKETFQFPVSWGMDLQSEHERYLTEKHFRRPTIVHDYPASLKPFYMRVNDGDAGPSVLAGPDAARLTVRAMDILAPSVGEIIGGSQREERLPMLEARMAAQHLDPAAYWWYLELRKYGTVPHSGFGLGLERILLLVTGMANIRDVIPFPRTPGSAEF